MTVDAAFDLNVIRTPFGDWEASCWHGFVQRGWSRGEAWGRVAGTHGVCLECRARA